MSAGRFTRATRPIATLLVVSFASVAGIYFGTATRSAVDEPALRDVLPDLKITVGDRFPGIPLVDGSGASVDSREAIGSDGAVVLFAYLDCPPCERMIAGLQALIDRGDLRNDHVLLIGPMTPVEHLKAFHTRYGITFPVYADTGALSMKQYGVEGFPLLVVVSVHRIVRQVRMDAHLPIDANDITSRLQD